MTLSRYFSSPQLLCMTFRDTLVIRYDVAKKEDFMPREDDSFERGQDLDVRLSVRLHKRQKQTLAALAKYRRKSEGAALRELLDSARKGMIARGVIDP